MVKPTITSIDEFLDGDKFLDGLHPEWGEGYLGVWQFKWNIIDGQGVSFRSHLDVSLKASLDRPTIMLIFQGHPIYRLDVVPDSEEKPNPPWAASLKLPNYVKGTHTHPWYANRAHVERNWDKSLPCRKPIEQRLSELEHVVAYIADDLKINITSEQRVVYLPEQGRFLN